MSTNYAPRHFLRAAPNTLLAQYFHGKDLLGDLDISALAETDIETLFQRWDELPPEQRSVVDSDFRLVHDLADEEGIRTLMEEARFHGEDLEPIFALMPGFFDKAFWTLLERRTYLGVASRFREADQLPSRYWLRRMNVPALSAPCDAARRKEFATAISAYFREHEGRGYTCVAETYERGQALYLFAYVEDYGRTDIGFDGARLDRRHRRPAFEVVFVHNSDQATLDVHCHSNRLVCRELQTIFARVVLGRDLPDDDKDNRVYDLNKFKRRDMEFVLNPLSGVESVALTSLRMSLLGGRSKRIIVEADPSHERHAVHDLLDDVLNTGRTDRGRDKIPLALVNITRVGLRATYKVASKRGRRTRSFFLAFPNGCTLRHDGKDTLLRTMLIDSGIEPQKNSASNPAA